MGQGAEDDKDVPNFMESEFSRKEIESFRRINNCANGECDASDKQPNDSACGERFEKFLPPKNGQPSHGDIYTGVKPAWGIHP